VALRLRPRQAGARKQLRAGRADRAAPARSGFRATTGIFAIGERETALPSASAHSSAASTARASGSASMRPAISAETMRPSAARPAAEDLLRQAEGCEELPQALATQPRTRLSRITAASSHRVAWRSCLVARPPGLDAAQGVVTHVVDLHRAAPAIPARRTPVEGAEHKDQAVTLVGQLGRLYLARGIPSGELCPIHIGAAKTQAGRATWPGSSRRFCLCSA